jgi:hypothetical protein
MPQLNQILMGFDLLVRYEGGDGAFGGGNFPHNVPVGHQSVRRLRRQ